MADERKRPTSGKTPDGDPDPNPSTPRVRQNVAPPETARPTEPATPAARPHPPAEAFTAATTRAKRPAAHRDEP